MIRKRKGDFGSRSSGQNVRNGLPQVHQAFAHSILKMMIPGTTFVSCAVLKNDAVPTKHRDKAKPSNVEHDIVDLCSNREHRSASKTVEIYLYTLCFCIYLEINSTSRLLSYFCLTNMCLYFA
jgi:hypothetical protein